MNIASLILVGLCSLVQSSVFYSYLNSSEGCQHPNQINFLSKCFCKPSYTTSTCEIQISTKGECSCKDIDLTNSNWRHPQGYRCEMLCRYSEGAGIINTIHSEWQWNQQIKQLVYYKNELSLYKTDLFKNYGLYEHLQDMTQGFNKFIDIYNFNLGDVLEIGPGGYPQIYNIVNNNQVSVKIRSLTFMDPLINEYAKIPKCPYFGGQIVLNRELLKATLIPKTLEEFYYVGNHPNKLYDTIIAVSVLPFSQDALAYLSAILKMLKPGGLLVFYERWFDDSVKSSQCNQVGFSTNGIQVSKGLLEHFLSHFEVKPYLSSAQTQGQLKRSKLDCKWLDDETGFFAIVRKKI